MVIEHSVSCKSFFVRKSEGIRKENVDMSKKRNVRNISAEILRVSLQ